jgi:hypothetical protein
VKTEKSYLVFEAEEFVPYSPEFASKSSISCPVKEIVTSASYF